MTTTPRLRLTLAAFLAVLAFAVITWGGRLLWWLVAEPVQ